MSEDYGGRVVVKCYSKQHKHRKNGVVCAAWRYVGEGRWTPHITSRHLRKHLTKPQDSAPDIGTTLKGDSKDFDLYDENATEELRSVYEIACPVCSPGIMPANPWYPNKGQNIPLTEETLFKVLNGLRHAGIEEVDLGQLRTILSTKG